MKRVKNEKEVGLNNFPMKVLKCLGEKGFRWMAYNDLNNVLFLFLLSTRLAVWVSKSVSDP